MLATWLINHLMCGISVGLPKDQFFYAITLDQQVIHRRTRVINCLFTLITLVRQKLSSVEFPVTLSLSLSIYIYIYIYNVYKKDNFTA